MCSDTNLMVRDGSVLFMDNISNSLSSLMSKLFSRPPSDLLSS